MIDVAGLRVMRAIADEGSFTGAAVALGTTQPAISQMVRRLEQRTGTALVERFGRTVRLTQAGEVLAHAAGPVLTALDSAEDEVAAIAGLRSGRVRVVAFPSSSATLVPHAIALLRARHPDVEVSFGEAEPPESLAMLREGDCDLAVAFSYEGSDVGRGMEDLDGFVTRELITDEVRLVVPRDHRLANDTAVTMKQLDGESWIAGCPRCRGHLVELAQHAGFTPSVSFETEDYVAVLNMVAEGLGVALVPDLILSATRHDNVSVVPIEPTPTRHIAAVTTDDLIRVPAVEAMLQALCDSAQAATQRLRPQYPTPSWSI